jgi:hypothetical protein
MCSSNRLLQLSYILTALCLCIFVNRASAWFSCLYSVNEVDLSGEWQCMLEETASGEDLKWSGGFASEKTVRLPGTLDENWLGHPNGAKSDQHLYKPLDYEGAAWFERDVNVPVEWKDRPVELVLERSKVTKVWVNGQYAGSSDLVYTQQVFDITRFVTPGESALIVISVNNNPNLLPVAGSHACSPDTQTNWNGIIGRMYLRDVEPRIHFVETRVTPDVASHAFRLDLTFSRDVSASEKLTISINPKIVCKTDDGKMPSTQLFYISDVVAGKTFSVTCRPDCDVHLWSDDSPNLYQLNVAVCDPKIIDTFSLTTGLRDFKATPDGFTINGHKTFLRGKHDACVFPLTGHPPMDVGSWVRYFSTLKEYGLNHIRCHTWTPPEAAFEAADRVGIYIECELPMWWAIDFKDPKQVDYMQRLGTAILDEYGNHPSFVMMALGNEITKDRADLKKLVDYLRAHDPRPLYAQGSNNRNWDPSYAEGDDFWASFRTGPYQADSSTDARLSMSFLDSHGEGGLLNIRHPSTTINFDKALERSPVPFSGYEVGQYQVFPNFTEIPKYTGVLKPLNLEMYRDRLAKAGMLDQAHDFSRASGALSVICYRADIEAMLRTKRFAAFNLLDLQDYPGQGTALVGMLDAFMDSKGLIRPDQWRQFCDETVILVEQEKFCWTDAETYSAGVNLSNFSAKAFANGKIRWSLEEGGHVLAEGSVAIDCAAYSGLCKSAQRIEIPFGSVVKKAPARLDLYLFLDGSNVKTSYPIWVYPASDRVDVPTNVVVADKLDDATAKALEGGARVILFPTAAAIEAHSIPNQFISEFWNWQMFTGFAEKANGAKSPGTLGLLMDEHSPAFAQFPTGYHTDYQWWPMVTGSRALILDDFAGYRPLVQVIDNIARDHRLGLVCEFRVGKGSLLVCGSRLPDIAGKYPEARQFYSSLLNYAASDKFDPQYAATLEQLRLLGL